MTDAALVERMIHMAEAVEKDPKHIGVYSTAERIAVALVLDRQDLLDYGSILECVDRLGDDWFKAALTAQRLRR